MNTSLLSSISTAYNLPQLHMHEQVTRGILSNNHILSDNVKRYFLKQWRFEDSDRVRETLRVEQYFADGQIPAILPLSTLHNERLLTHDGAFYSLYPYVNGKHIEQKDVRGKALESMATMLGKIHRLSLNGYPEVEKFKWWNEEKVVPKMENILQIIEKIPNKSKFDLMAAEYLTRKLKLNSKNTIRVESIELPSDTLIHGDYHESNIFFDKNDVSHVFDFEKAEIAPRVYELIRSVKLTLIDGKYTDDNIERAGQFIAAYSNEYPISADEVRYGLQLSFTKGLFGCWIEEEHYLKNNFRPDVFLENGLKSLQYQTDHLEEMSTSFVKYL